MFVRFKTLGFSGWCHAVWCGRRLRTHIDSCPCRILGQCTNSCARLGRLLHRRTSSVDSLSSIARYAHRHRSHGTLSNLGLLLLTFVTFLICFVTFLTFVRTCVPLGWFCYILPNQLILYHKVMDMSSFSGCVLLRFLVLVLLRFAVADTSFARVTLLCF